MSASHSIIIISFLDYLLKHFCLSGTQLMPSSGVGGGTQNATGHSRSSK